MIQSGRVKFFKPTAGYGFIAANSGGEVYVRWHHIPAGVTLRAGDEVEFTRGPGMCGEEA